MRDPTARRDEDRIVDSHGRDFIAMKHRFPANAAGFLLAPVIWLGYFVAAYSLHGAFCAAASPGPDGPAALRLALAALTILACVAIAAAGAGSFRAWRRLLHELEDDERQPRDRSAFLAYGALLHAALFFVATLWIGVPILLIGPCANV